MRAVWFSTIIIVGLGVTAVILVFSNDERASSPNRPQVLPTTGSQSNEESPNASAETEYSEAQISNSVAESPDSGKPLELLGGIEGFDQTWQQNAHEAAQTLMDQLSPGWILRWRPVVVDALAIVEPHVLNSQPDVQVQPVQTVRITPFNGTSFVIENNYFAEEGRGYVWLGEITEGGTGSVSIHVLPGDEWGPVSMIRVFSDYGSFAINPTERPSVSVVSETNPYLDIKVQ